MVVNLGKMYLEEGNLESAKEYFENALETFSSFFEEDHPRIAEVWVFMGILHNKIGRPVEAFPCFNEAKRVLKLVFGESNPVYQEFA